MAENNETIEITLEETGEVLPLRIGSLVNDARSIMLDWLRAQGDAWQKMSEQDQKDAIIRAENVASDLVRKMAGIVAQGRYDVIHANLKQYAVKDGLVTITGVGLAETGAIIKLNDVGKKALKIVVADEGQFDQERPRQEIADPDQPDLIPDDEPDAPDAPDNVTSLHDRSMVPNKKKAEDAEKAAENKPAPVQPDPAPEQPDQTSQEPSDGSDLGEVKADDGALRQALDEAQTAPEQPEGDPADMGFNAMVDGHERDTNPFEPAVDEEAAGKATRWFLGWDQAWQQSRDLILSGQTDQSMGKDRMEQGDPVSQKFYDAGYDGTETVEQA